MAPFFFLSLSSDQTHTQEGDDNVCVCDMCAGRCVYLEHYFAHTQGVCVYVHVCVRETDQQDVLHQ